MAGFVGHTTQIEAVVGGTYADFILADGFESGNVSAWQVVSARLIDM